MINIWKTISFIIVVTVTLFIVLNTEFLQTVRSGNLDSIILILKDNPLNKFLFTFIMMMIHNFFTIIPLILIISINYSIFGFVNGLIWSWFTSIIAAVFWFYGSRYFFHNWVQKKAKRELLKKLEDNGLLFVFQARIFPFFPSSVINLIGGLSSIKFKHFLLGTMFGNLLFFFVLSFIPAGLMSGNVYETILISTGLILLTLVFYSRFKKKQKRSKQIG